jgi:hypothetical protein
MVLTPYQRHELQERHDGGRAKDDDVIEALDLRIVDQDDEAVALKGGEPRRR